MKVYGFKLMNSMSFGDFMTAGGFIQKIAPGTTVIHFKQANRQQQVSQPAKPVKDDSSWSPSLTTRRRSPPGTIVGRLAH